MWLRRSAPVQPMTDPPNVGLPIYPQSSTQQEAFGSGHFVASPDDLAAFRAKHFRSKNACGLLNRSAIICSLSRVLITLNISRKSVISFSLHMSLSRGRRCSCVCNSPHRDISSRCSSFFSYSRFRAPLLSPVFSVNGGGGGQIGLFVILSPQH